MSLDVLNKQSFSKWLDLDYFKDVINNKNRGKIDSAVLNTVSNMLSVIYAMKMQDFNDGMSEHNPGTKEEVAEKFAENLNRYLKNCPQAKNNWLDLYIIAYSGESIQLNGMEKELEVIPNDPSNNMIDDEYAICAAAVVAGLDANMSKEQAMHMVNVLTFNANKRKQIIAERLDKLSKFKKSTSQISSGLWFIIKSKLAFAEKVPLNALFSGVSSAAFMILCSKFVPAKLMFMVIPASFTGFIAGNKLYDTLRELSLKIDFSSSRFFGGKKIDSSIQKVKEHDSRLDFPLASNLHEIDFLIDNLKMQLSQEALSKQAQLDQGKSGQVQDAQSLVKHDEIKVATQRKLASEIDIDAQQIPETAKPASSNIVSNSIRMGLEGVEEVLGRVSEMAVRSKVHDLIQNSEVQAHYPVSPSPTPPIDSDAGIDLDKS
jgi:hypothetical protein